MAEEISNELGKISKIIEEISPRYRKLGEPLQEHTLIYDSLSETLEPTYFWVVDKMNEFFGGKVEKLVDNFVSTPGSGHFGELGTRATRMQEESMKILGAVNTVVKSILNLIYDLKEFEIRLEHYNASKNKEDKKAEAGLLALKQIWMDSVDVKRGRGSINMLAQDLNFVTLRDAFMAAKDDKNVDKMDLNDRVKRILKPRIKEFLEWKERSEKELRKRFEVEKSYLKSQVNSLKLYTSWLRPYLMAAENLKMNEMGRHPGLVKAFNTIFLQLVLLGKTGIKIEEAITAKDLPPKFDRIKWKREYHSCVVVELQFRGIPSRVGQQSHYAFGGRAEVNFKAYALNDDELAMLDKKLREESVEEGLKLMEGITTDSLEQIKEDIDHFLENTEEKEEEEKGKDVNPFLALFGIYEKRDKKKEVKKEIKEVKKDNYEESLLRSYTESVAKERCYDLFDIYKKAHGMASHPKLQDFEEKPAQGWADKLLEI